MIFTRYHTRSGSMYDVRQDGHFLVRQARAGGAYGAHGGPGTRFFGGAWLQAEDVGLVNGHLVIVWGSGRDQWSPPEEEDGIPDVARIRNTVTSVILREELVEES